MLEILAGPVLEPVVKALLCGVKSKLNPSDLEKAIKQAFLKAWDNDKVQDNDKKLFHDCKKGDVEKFVCEFFSKEELSELQKPLKAEGKPDINFLTKAFEQELKKKKQEKNSKVKNIDLKLVHPWMKIFVDTYFENTKTYTSSS